MAADGSLASRLGRNGVGCAIYFVVYAAIAWAIDYYTAADVAADARPWVGIVASAFLTMGIGTVWGLMTGYSGGNARPELLADAASASFPQKDGPILATGIVRPTGTALRAPISGAECVAYQYRMYYEVMQADHGVHGRRRRDVVPVYWGMASRPFVIDSSKRVVRVAAVPQLFDAQVRLEGAEDVERARRYVDNTRFETATGPVGVIGTAFKAMDDFLTDADGQSRSDWMHRGDPRDPATLILEECVLPVGVVASVVGPWSASQRAIVPHVEGAEALWATATTGPAEALLAGSGGVRPTATSAVVTAIVMFAIGAAIIWGAMKFSGEFFRIP
jgi:hypothetical protein